MDGNQEVPKIERPNLFNIEAEQTVLGAVILNNEHLSRIIDIVRPEHFYETAHQRIFEHIIHTTQRANLTADSVTLKLFFDNDEVVSKIGGSSYLPVLLTIGAGIVNIVDYGKLIQDLAMKRQLVAIGEEIVNKAYKDGMVESSEKQIDRAEGELFQLSFQNEHSRGFRSLSSSLAETIGRAEVALKRDSNISGLPTNFIDLDRLLGGLQSSDLLILAGRPSMGKSAFAINIAYNVAKFMGSEHEKNQDSPKQSVGFISLEMSSEQIASRILSIESGVNSQLLKTGEINEDLFNTVLKKAEEVSRVPLYIDDTAAMSIAAIRSKVRRMIKQKGLACLVVDYLQLAHGTSNHSKSNRVLEIGEITMGLKAIAKEFNIPVLALSQLSRSVEQRDDKRPQLSDLRESGSIEQDADIVMFIYREAYYAERKKPVDGDPRMQEWITLMEQIRNKTEIIVAKHRNGPIGTVNLHFNNDNQRFTDWSGLVERR